MSEPPGSFAAAAALGAAALLVLCAPIAGCEPSPSVSPAAGGPGEPSEAELAALREQLADERSRREELEAEVQWLRYQLEEFVWDVPPTAAGGEEAAEGKLGEADDAERGVGERPTELADGSRGPGRRRSDERSWFQAEELRGQGLDSAQIDRLHEAFTRSEMDLLELEDRARREGWYGTSRYWTELRQMREQLRADLGDEDYDRLLYASGRQNRVVVDDLLERSPASDAGIRPDDVICRYDGSRVFRAGELKSATSQGRAGELVPLDIVRDGERVRIYVPRGPLGIKLSQARQLPLPGC